MSEWQEIDRLRTRLRGIENRIASQEIKAAQTPPVSLGYVLAPETVQLREVATARQEVVTAVKSIDAVVMPGQCASFCLAKDGQKYFIPRPGMVMPIQLITPTTGRPVNIDILGNRTLTGDTLPVIVADPTIQFHDATYPLAAGRVLPGMIVANLAGERAYLVSLLGHTNANITTTNLALEIDGQNGTASMRHYHQQVAPLTLPGRRASDGRGADQVIVTGGGTEVLPWAAEILRDGGAVHYFAGGAGDALPLRLETLYHRELTLTATYSSSPADLAEAFALLTAGEIRVDRLVTHRVSLGRLATGVDLMRRREALKVYVTP